MARQRWGKRIEFFLTAIGYSVGVGDLWRFPYLVMKNGGGAFLIPVVIFNLVGAIPIVYLEMIMGQYSQSGAVSVWNVCPLFKGVGFGTLIATFFFSIYYAVIIGWMLFYFVHSFWKVLPWTTCDNSWNIPETCVINKEYLLKNVTSAVENATTMATTMASGATGSTTTMASGATGSTMGMNGNETISAEMLTAAEQFWRYGALHVTGGLDDLGGMNWPLVGCLAAIEVLCFLCIFKGVQLTGKIVYFTVLGPFVLLIVFLIRGAILPGAEIGIKYYVTPDLEKLKDVTIWAEACMQVFVSIGPGFGGMITFASYNKFSNNCMRDAIMVCIMDLLTGFFGGFVIFSVMGHVSYKTGISMDEFRQSGYGLGFVAYPEAANYLPPPQLWCALFFFMSIFLGIDSQFPNYEIVVTGLTDEFPKLLKKKTSIMTLVVIVVAFLLALPQVTEGGVYLLTLVDWYASTFSVTVFALIEVLVMVWIYGMSNIEKNMKEMTGRGIPLIFKFCWYFATPLLLGVTLAFTIGTYSPPSFNDYVYPRWAVNLGWTIAAASLVPIPIYIIYKLIKTPGDSLLERLKINLKPTELWGPPDDIRLTEAHPNSISPNDAITNGKDNPTFVVDSQDDAKKVDPYFVNGTRL